MSVFPFFSSLFSTHFPRREVLVYREKSNQEQQEGRKRAEQQRKKDEERERERDSTKKATKTNTRKSGKRKEKRKERDIEERSQSVCRVSCLFSWYLSLSLCSSRIVLIFCIWSKG